MRYATNLVLFGACLLRNKVPLSFKQSQSLIEYKSKSKTFRKIDCSYKTCSL